MKVIDASVEFFTATRYKIGGKDGRSLPKISLLLTDPFAAIDKPR
jgi:hypothetical protein